MRTVTPFRACCEVERPGVGVHVQRHLVHPGERVEDLHVLPEPLERLPR